MSHKRSKLLAIPMLTLVNVFILGIVSPPAAEAGCAQHTWSQTHASGHPTTLRTKAATLAACVGVGPTYCEGAWTILDSDWDVLDGLQIYLQVDPSVANGQWYLLWLDAGFTQPVNTAPPNDYRAGCLGLEMEQGHASCGNDAKEGAEDCDGADDDNCPGLCEVACTCPTPVCGNDITEFGEECDGTEVSGCTTGVCQNDCACLPPPYETVSCFQHLWDPSHGSNPYTTLQMKWGCNGFTPSQWDLIPGASSCVELVGEPMTIVESTWTSLHGTHVYLQAVATEWFLMWADAAFTVPVVPTAQEAAAVAGYLPGCGGGALVAGHIELSACGDGTVDAGEECDDGNTDDGDCCAADCTFEPQGSTCPEDGNPCTDHQCDATGTCQTINNSDPCEDGDYCTVGDQCSSGACGAGGARDCSASDDDCNDGVCNETTNSCEPQAANENAGCEDGQFCTENTTCSGGSCGGGTSLDCSSVDGDCLQGVCNETTDACEPQAANEGGSCSDGDSCTAGDECAAGVCEASGQTNPLSKVKVAATLKQGADNDKMKLHAILPLDQIGDFAAAPRVEIVITNDADEEVYAATVPAADFENMGGRDANFRFRDIAGAVAEANNLRMVFVKINPVNGEMRVRARMKGTELPAAAGTPTMTLQIILGEAAETACLTGLDVPCDGNDRKLTCRTQ